MSFVNSEFILGANYWPRKTGVRMWKEFDEYEIADDFAALSGLGLNTVRIFLLWEDFQNIREFYASQLEKHNPLDVRFGDWHEHSPLIDPVMVERFDSVIEIAKRCNLRLIVTLLTTWMSGIVFEPAFVKGRNIFSDPSILRYQTDYVKFFAERYCSEKQILAWDLGNEQNCVMPCESRDAGWLWTHVLSREISKWDKNHAVTSGMHSLDNTGAGMGGFAIKDISNSLDFLCIHPYTRFFPDECPDRSDNIRPGYLAEFQSKLYEGIGGKPVMAEEFGTLGNGYMSDECAAGYVRKVLHSLYECGNLGALYWCGFDFICRDMPPYNYDGMEVHLGLFCEDGTPNLIGMEFRRFAEFLEANPPHLSNRAGEDAMVMVPWREENQPVLFNSYVLARMAGLNPKIATVDGGFSAGSLMLFPCATRRTLRIKDWDALKQMVASGGTAYFSFNGMQFPEENEFFGIRVLTWQKEAAGIVSSRCECDLDKFGLEDFSYMRTGSMRLIVDPVDAKVLATDMAGAPLIFEHSYGDGLVYLVTEPMELYLSKMPDVFPENGFYKFYSYMGHKSGATVPDLIEDFEYTAVTEICLK